MGGGRGGSRLHSHDPLLQRNATTNRQITRPRRASKAAELGVVSPERRHSRLNPPRGPGSCVLNPQRALFGSAIRSEDELTGQLNPPHQFSGSSSTAPSCTVVPVGPPQLSRVPHGHREALIKGPHHGGRLGNVNRSHSRAALHSPCSTPCWSEREISAAPRATVRLSL